MAGLELDNILGSLYSGGKIASGDNGNVYTPSGNGATCMSPLSGTARHLQLNLQSDCDIIAAGHGSNSNVIAACDNRGGVSTYSVMPRGGDGARLVAIKLASVRLKRKCSDIAFSPDGKKLATASGKELRVWRMPDSPLPSVSPLQQLLSVAAASERVTAIRFDDRGEYIIAGTSDMHCRVLTAERRTDKYEPKLLGGHMSKVIACAFASEPLGSSGAYTATKDGMVRSWRYEEEKQAYVIESRAVFNGVDGRSVTLKSMEIEPSSGIASAGTSDGRIIVLDLPSLETMCTVASGCGEVPVSSMALAWRATAAQERSRRWVCFGIRATGHVVVWDPDTSTTVLSQGAHPVGSTRAVSCGDSASSSSRSGSAAAAAVGTVVATGGEDGSLRAFDAKTGYCLASFGGEEQTSGAPPPSITSVTFLPSGNAILAAHNDGTVKAFDLHNHRHFRTMRTEEKCRLGSVTADQGGEVIAASSPDTFLIYTFSLRTGKELDQLSAHSGPVQMLEFLPQGLTVASASWDGDVRLWDLPESTSESLSHGHEVLALSASKDGKLLATACIDSTISMWSLRDRSIVGTVEAHRDMHAGEQRVYRRASVDCVAFSPDSSVVAASGSLAQSICVYDARGMVLLRRLQIATSRSAAGVLNYPGDPNDLRNTEHELNGNGEGELDEVDNEDALPGSSRAAELNKRGRKREVGCHSLSFSSAGNILAGATSEGVVVYSKPLMPSLGANASRKDGFVIDKNTTPERVRKAMEQGRHGDALRQAISLGDSSLMRECFVGTPKGEIGSVSAAMSEAEVPVVVKELTELVEGSSHVERAARWAHEVAKVHGIKHVTQGAGGGGGVSEKDLNASSAFRGLASSLGRIHDEIEPIASGNMYMLEQILGGGL